MSLLVVMPTSGQVNVSSLAAKLNISDLYHRLPKERAVQVKVPKFKLEYAQELKDVFIKLGKRLFDLHLIELIFTRHANYYGSMEFSFLFNLSSVLCALCQASEMCFPVPTWLTWQTAPCWSPV